MHCLRAGGTVSAPGSVDFNSERPHSVSALRYCMPPISSAAFGTLGSLLPFAALCPNVCFERLQTSFDFCRKTELRTGRQFNTQLTFMICLPDYPTKACRRRATAVQNQLAFDRRATANGGLHLLIFLLIA